MDERLREAVREQAGLIAPDLDAHLAAVLERGARARRRGRGPILAAASVALLVMLLTVQLLTVPSRSVPGVAAPSASAGDGVIGRYAVVLDDSADVHAHGLGGRWTLEFAADDTLLLTPPLTYPGGGQPLSGVAYSLSAGSLRTNLFSEQCGSVGVYGWERSDAGLSLTPDTEDCDLRRTLLSTADWQELR